MVKNGRITGGGKVGGGKVPGTLKKAALALAMLAPVVFLFCIPNVSRAAHPEFRRDPAIGGPLLERAKTQDKNKNKNTPKIILKRDTGGRYSWIVEGTEVLQVIREDIQLRRYMGRMEKTKGLTDGQTATKPEKGQKIIFKNGMWQPVKK